MTSAGHEAIQRNPQYQELVRTRSSFGWTLTIITLLIYFGFILLIGYAPKFLGIRMGDSVMTIGLLCTASGHLPVTIGGIAIFTAGFFGAHAVASGWVSQRAQSARAAAASLYLFAYYLGSSVFGSLGGLVWSRQHWFGIEVLVGTLMLIALATAVDLSRREQGVLPA